MGKRGGKQKGQFLTPGHHQGGLTLREESSGRKLNKRGSTSVNAKSMLKLQHLQKLAIWASGDDSIPSLGAFFGHRFAACGEAIGVPPDPSLFSCQRCESILQPGFNCTVRIEKDRAKVKRRRKKPNNSPQNHVVYKCHFCSHWNLKRGTPEGHMKEICPPQAKPSSKSALANPKFPKYADQEKVMEIKAEVNNMDDIASLEKASVTSIIDSPVINMDEIASSEITSVTPIVNTPATNMDEIASSEIASATPIVNTPATNMDEVASSEIASATPIVNSPTTPLLRTGVTLLEGKKRRRNKSASKKPPETDANSAKTDAEKAISTSSKRRRKTWTSLKEIAESGQQDNSSRNITNLTIPFFL